MLVTRRRFLRVGGTLSMGAVFAACLGGGGSKRPRDSSGGATGRRADATIIRTLSSVEAAAVAVYATGLDSGLFVTPGVANLARRFRTHHEEHAALFEGTTRELGAEPFGGPNPVVMQALQPEIDNLRDEASVVGLVFDVETILAHTYQATMGTFADKSFNVAAMSVGGAEARHAAALAPTLGLPPVPQGFETTERAVAAGGGV